MRSQFLYSEPPQTDLILPLPLIKGSNIYVRLAKMFQFHQIGESYLVKFFIYFYFVTLLAGVVAIYLKVDANIL